MTYSDKGESAYKVIGYPSSKYSVRVWPEILPLLGIDADQLQPGPNPFSAQVRALMGERGPKKIVGLADGAPPAPAPQPQEPEEEFPF